MVAYFNNNQATIPIVAQWKQAVRMLPKDKAGKIALTRRTGTILVMNDQSHWHVTPKAMSRGELALGTENRAEVQTAR